MTCAGRDASCPSRSRIDAGAEGGHCVTAVQQDDRLTECRAVQMLRRALFVIVGATMATRGDAVVMTVMPWS